MEKIVSNITTVLHRIRNEILTVETGQDMQFLADDELLLHREEHPYPVDTSFLYTGRLVAKFLLSFTNESVIFASKI
jgi:hypothetical protein